MKVNDPISEKYIYSPETADSSAININVFGSTAILSPFSSHIEDFCSFQHTHLEKPILFRVIDGQLFSKELGSPNI